MKQVTGNMWTYPADWVGVTTNGVVKANGEAVMGRGTALEAKKRFPDLPKRLGHCIEFSGNRPYFFMDLRIFTFPTKHDWKNKSDLKLIKESAIVLAEDAQSFPTQIYLLPRPGCSNGGLKWEDVEPVISFLPDNVIIIHNN